MVEAEEAAEAAGVVGVKAAVVAVAAGNKGSNNVQGGSKAALNSNGNEQQPGQTCCGAYTYIGHVCVCVGWLMQIWSSDWQNIPATHKSHHTHKLCDTHTLTLFLSGELHISTLLV